MVLIAKPQAVSVVFSSFRILHFSFRLLPSAFFLPPSSASSASIIKVVLHIFQAAQ